MIRIVFHAVLGTALMAGYFVINRSEVESRVSVAMPGWVPFWPVMALPYVACLPIAWFTTLTIRDGRRFTRCVVALVIGFALLLPLWIFYPTEMPRPDAASNWWNVPYFQLIGVDNPYNILPCGHIMPPVVATWFVCLERKRWLRWMLPAIALSAIAIVTTYQHRPVDVLVGIAIAAAAIWLSQLIRIER